MPKCTLLAGALVLPGHPVITYSSTRGVDDTNYV